LKQSTDFQEISTVDVMSLKDSITA